MCLTRYRYKGPTRQKLYGEILQRLHGECLLEQRKFLEQRTGYGRAITGDGATILGTKFINFLCHEYGKGCMLCRIKDCTGRLQEVGSIEATFIAHEMMETIRLDVVIPIIFAKTIDNFFIFYLSDTLDQNRSTWL